MNQTETIQMMLERAGLHVHGIYNGFILMEDPACITRGFQNFISDAWIALTVITGFMIMMWGIAKIRGAKLSELGHFKTLMLIFLILSCLGPILNFVYGGNLMGMGCKEVRVKLEEVQALLPAGSGGNIDTSTYQHRVRVSPEAGKVVD